MSEPLPVPVPERIAHRHIEVFRALMLAGTATGAASMLFTSQPTVSRELARLEQLLGYALFDRSQGRLRPNARALQLWDEVQRSWAGLDRVVERALELGRPHQASLHVLCLPALSHALLPRALALLHAGHGPVSVSVATQEAPLLQEWMAAQRYDLGLSELADAPPGTRTSVAPLRTTSAPSMVTMAPSTATNGTSPRHGEWTVRTTWSVPMDTTHTESPVAARTRTYRPKGSTRMSLGIPGSVVRETTRF